MTFKQHWLYPLGVGVAFVVILVVLGTHKPLPQHAKSCTCIAASDKGDTVCSHRGSWGRGR